MVVNDQGGEVIICYTEDVAPTLRSQTKHHEPLVVIDDGSDGNDSGSSDSEDHER